MEKAVVRAKLKAKKRRFPTANILTPKGKSNKKPAKHSLPVGPPRVDGLRQREGY